MDKSPHLRGKPSSNLIVEKHHAVAFPHNVQTAQESAFVVGTVIGEIKHRLELAVMAI